MKNFEVITEEDWETIFHVVSGKLTDHGNANLRATNTLINEKAQRGYTYLLNAEGKMCASIGERMDTPSDTHEVIFILRPIEEEPQVEWKDCCKQIMNWKHFEGFDYCPKCGEALNG